MTSSISDQIAYRDACRLAAIHPEHFANFRQHPDLAPIWENLGRETGQRYLDQITEFNWDSVVNDDFGNPLIAYYPEIQRRVSPTTIRHVHTYQQLLRYFDLDSIEGIVEIGGGYGGLAAVVLSQKKLRYRIHDLPETLILANRFVDACGYSLDCSLDLFNPPKNHLVVSNYAFSELSPDTQQFYLDSVLSTAKAVYMVYNHIGHHFGLQPWSVDYFAEQLEAAGFKVEISDEVPLTYLGNKLLIANR